ncbi:flavin reductase [Nocardioides sp. JQ2195]|uniref:flavin reductase family protein n=1 Tax=Nocardioides sp. JQ2195 TaxID=2592334 RepID=UPI00143E99AA|nr:flavin reductase [Nocardioides sp. JQ2195]QIX27123.1 flavin reductase [Nocardioides sp. JQ2195]
MDDAFDRLMAAVDPALVVVTTAVEGVRAGCLVGFHSQSSIDPEHYCFWLSKANHTYRVGLRATHFGLHFLPAHRRDLAERFGTVTGEDADKFAGLEVTSHEHGVPLLADCPNRMVLERISLLDVGGDHVNLATRVLHAEHGGEFTPLRVSDAAGLEPGHGSEERSIEP